MSLQRIGLVSDVHTQAENLALALEFLRESGVERVLCTGDIPNGPHQKSSTTNQCIKLLRENQVLTIRGNHDRWLLADQMRGLPNVTPLETLNESSLAFIRSLPSTLTLDSCAGKILLCHGIGENDMHGVKSDDDHYALRWKPELHALIEKQEYAFVIAGHTHQRMARRFARSDGALFVINAGTLHPDFSPCFAIADFAKQRVQFFDLKDNSIVQSEEFPLN